MVKLVSAKCPNCGATLKLSKEDENVECEYCHNTIIVDDAIACYKLKISGTVSVEGIATNAELIDSANELLDMNEYLKAKRKFLEFSEKCPDNYQGWLGLLICRTRNFQIRDNNIMFENDINKYRDHFFRTAPQKVQDQYFEIIDRYFDPDKYLRMKEQEDEEKRKKEFDEKKRIASEKKEKNIKHIKEIGGSVGIASLKIWNIILYGFGGLLILAGLSTIVSSPVSAILGVLFGLSLFKVFYDKAKEKFNLSEKTLKILRVIIPIVLMILFGMALPSDTTKSSTKESNDNTNIKVEEKKETKKQTPKKVIFLKNTKANDYYMILCEVAGLKANKPTAVVGNIIEYSSYDNNYMIEVGANKSTDEIAYVTITTLKSSDSMNVFMALNRLDYKGKDSAKLTDFITKNMGKTANITIGDLNFSMWTNNEKPIIKAETPDFEKYVEDM